MRSPHEATPACILQKQTINLRLILVCIAAASVGLPIVIISIAKILLLLGAIAILLFTKDATIERTARRPMGLTAVVVLVIMAAFAASLLWTTGSQAEAYSSLGKYGKLLMIPLIVALLRTRAQAVYALGAFSVVQLFLLLGSWMLFFGLPVPWATAPALLRHNAVFSSYLDQGIMAALFAAICWHLRTLVPGRYGPHCAISIAMLALLNVFFVFDGRSGHVVAIALMSLAIMWQLPTRFRAGILLLPFLLLLALYIASPRVQHRFELAKTEIQAFSFAQGANVVTGSSSGIRLHFWHRAVQSIAEKPFSGSGIGSWSSEYNRIEKKQNAAAQSIAELGNPHQEYLQWGVQLGIPGIVLLLALMLSILRDTLAMQAIQARATQSALAALAIACLFNSSLYDALIGDFFCVVLGLLLAFGAFKTSPDHRLGQKTPASLT